MPRSMHHDSERIVLESRKDGYHVVAARARHHHLIRGTYSELGGPGADHLYGRGSRSARENLNVQTAFCESAVELSRVESAELWRRLPVQREPGLGGLAASGEHPQRG